MIIDSPTQLGDIISRELLSKYSQVKTLNGILSIAIEWLLIIGSVILTEYFFSWPLYLLSVIFIGARLLALGLIMHEAVHYLISKNKRWNDFVAELFCAWPLFISMRSYRVKHLAHHQWLNTDKDPDFISKTDKNWSFPMSFSKFTRILLLQLSGLGIFDTFRVMSGKGVKEKRSKTPFWYHFGRVSFYLLIFISFIYYQKGMLLLKYWIIPFATWTQLANRLRRIAEHSGIENRPLAMQTRTTKHSFLIRLLLVPKNISYHCEHHLYPTIPCYNLPKIHQELMKHELVKNNFHVSNSYKKVFQECIHSTKTF